MFRQEWAQGKRSCPYAEVHSGVIYEQGRLTGSNRWMPNYFFQSVIKQAKENKNKYFFILIFSYLYPCFLL